MSMLSRFRKPGGFIQLLCLVESCEPEKQKNLLNMIATEDPGWGHLVKLKSLSFNKILDWPENVLRAISPHISETVAVASLSVLTGPQQDRWLNSFPQKVKTAINTRFESATLSPSEGQAAAIRIVQIVRDLESKGLLKLSVIDAKLELDKRIAA